MAYFPTIQLVIWIIPDDLGCDNMLLLFFITKKTVRSQKLLFQALKLLKLKKTRAAYMYKTNSENFAVHAGVSL